MSGSGNDKSEGEDQNGKCTNIVKTDPLFEDCVYIYL